VAATRRADTGELPEKEQRGKFQALVLRHTIEHVVLFVVERRQKQKEHDILQHLQFINDDRKVR
jgi:hypothetical protein